MNIQVWRGKQHLDQAFALAAAVPAEPTELRAHLARYLVVLVSGFVERSVKDIGAEFVDRYSVDPVKSFVGSQVRRWSNFDSERLLTFAGYFDKRWAADLRTYLDGPPGAALDSLVTLRNAVAHGQSISTTLADVTDYYAKAYGVLERFDSLCGSWRP
jgi:RiboL-PSP-HEPN